MNTIFLVLDTGLARSYFLDTDLADTLVKNGLRLVILVPEVELPLLAKTYPRENVIFESMRDKQAAHYRDTYQRGWQFILEHVRRASASPRIPLTYVDTHRRRKESTASPSEKTKYALARPLIYLLRGSRLARRFFHWLIEKAFTPNIYTDLFDQYQPALVVSNTAGWRLDQYLLREAHKRGLRTLTVIVGWDNPSSQGLPGASVDDVIVWSEIHKWEMAAGVDWPEKNIYIGGMPLYDGYISKRWQMSREEYCKLHNLDPERRLIAFAATALSISPNFHLIEMLARMVSEEQFDVPAQLLIRLHPNHFKPMNHYKQEAETIRHVMQQYQHVHIVEPKQGAGGMDRYSGEDFPEKASMLAHCDLLVTIYSTMVVEAALHDKPFVSACIDIPGGWGGNFFSVPLHEVPTWPTAARVNKLHAGRLALTEAELRQAINDYLRNPRLESAERRSLIERELTYIHGEATQKTAEIILSLANGEQP